jgi:phage-related protein (TIGR01555 family)
MSFWSRLLGRSTVTPEIPAPRLDAAPGVEIDPTPAAISNYVSQIGGPRGKAAYTTITRGRVRPDVETWGEYFDTDGVYRRLCGQLPTFGLYRGWRLDDDSDDLDPLRSEFDRLHVASTVREAATLGQGLGQAAVLMVTRDANPRERLDPRRCRGVIRLQTVDPRELEPVEWDSDIASETFGSPLVWRYVPRRTGMGLAGYLVHESRLLWFRGASASPASLLIALRPGMTGVPMGQLWHDALMRRGAIAAAGAEAAQELSVAVFKLQDAALKQAASGSSYMAHVQLINAMKSLVNGVLLTEGDEYKRENIAITGFADLAKTAMDELVLATGRPLPLLFGQPPSGLSTDGESWWRAWSADVEMYQEEQLVPALTRLAACLYGPAAPLGWQVRMQPLGTLTAMELAEIRAKETASDSTAIADGVLEPAHAALRYRSPTGYQATLPPRPADWPEPEPDAVAMGEALAEQARGAASKPTTDADFTGKAMLSVTLSEAGRAAWAELVQRAGAVVGALEGYEPGEPSVVEAPHVTVLYLGAVAELQLPEIEQRARAIVEDLGPIALRAIGVTTFPPGPTSEGRVPVVVEVRAWELDDLYNRLLRALAPFVTADQFPRFRPHVTLGFVANPAPEQVAALAELLPRKDVPSDNPMTLGSVAAVDLHYGGQVVARLPLLSKRVDGDDAAAQP